MGKATSALTAFIRNIPDGKYPDIPVASIHCIGIPISDWTIKGYGHGMELFLSFPSEAPFDVFIFPFSEPRPLTTGDPQYYNLQVRINNQTTISTLKRVKGETVAHTLVPADGSWTPEQIRQALLANTLISMTGILGQMYTAFPEEGGYRRDTWNLLLECFQ
ncbi:hypothetical protein AO1008_01897 [Aspergillus oryzae 100-8]|uniref:Uncharacterized protein n=1 Tax=Aspergillus oryzae (strain 3.042) TaxID=1160506 RepID=I8IKR7_ASPO3|nr:hypothetical protein Ao3042_04004 [Aspergillus oryzae 3.042]KDE76026.1 hypothetical protein AO1008_01897 [Aspergillus oryzae 100-8]|eukprot:EIT79571.1 hypothetical protein Ao3042_04004 [Aspergillus oryzae 3.042]